MIELHCHLDGIADAAMRAELAGRGLAETPETVLELHLARLAAQGVSAAEIMVSGLLPGDEGEVIARFAGLRAIADRAALEVELLVAIGRGPVERATRQVARIPAIARAGWIAGVAIAGDETQCTIASIAPLLAQVRAAGLGLEIHAGETCGPASVWDALEHGRPDRIGHAVTAFADPRLIDELRARDVHLEMCPSSNLHLGVVPEIARHPIAQARDLGLAFSINTDDPGLFACSMASEHALCADQLGFTGADFAAVRRHAERARFRRR